MVMLNKLVPMIRPLYEIATPSSAAAANAASLVNNPDEGAATTTTSAVVDDDAKDKHRDMLPPLRKSKRLRSPFLDSGEGGGDDDGGVEPRTKKSKDDINLSLCTPEGSEANGNTVNASNNAQRRSANNATVSSTANSSGPSIFNPSTSKNQPTTTSKPSQPNKSNAIVVAGAAASSSSSKSKKPKSTPINTNKSTGFTPAKPQSSNDEQFQKVTGVCDQERIMWAKVKGHPYWPTQVVRMDYRLAEEDRFKTAARFRRKGDDTCLMYFGTCEVAWINASKATLSWSAGLEKGLHKVLKARPKYQLALQQVLRYCARSTEYPRGWWCEPSCFSLSHAFTDICRDEEKNQKKLVRYSGRAEQERVCWARMRGYPFWPVQVLPFDIVIASYPELRLRAPQPGQNPTSWPCMFFGTGEVAMIADRAIAPFITGVRKMYWAASDRHDFIISLGEMWGYLQEKRVWPSGYLSGRLWWNHEQAPEAALEAREQPKIPMFHRLKTSSYAAGVTKPPASKLGEAPKCTCKISPNACSDDSCINVASRFWCDPNCGAGQYCSNRPFYSRATPRVSPFYTADQRGWGLRLDESVKKGDFIIDYVGEIIDRDTLSKRLEKKSKNSHTEYYIMETNDEHYIDAEHRGNMARFINSSCAPNCQSQKWTDPRTGQTHVGIFALKNIKGGTELTYDYRQAFGFGFGENKVRTFVCRCRAHTCCMLEPAERDHVARCMGKRIRVRWDDGWYTGRVDSFDQDRKRFRVLYDDGDDEELTLGLPTLPKNGDGISFRLLDEYDNEIKNGI